MSNMCLRLRPTVLVGKAERRRGCVYGTVCRLTAKKLRNKVTHSAASFLSIAALLIQEVKFALKQCVKSRGLLVASRGHSSDNGYQLRPELLRVTVLVESRGHFFSCTSCVPRWWSEDGTSESC